MHEMGRSVAAPVTALSCRSRLLSGSPKADTYRHLAFVLVKSR